MSNKMRTLMIVLVVALALTGLGVWTASAQEPDDTTAMPCGGQMMGRGMGMGMMHQHGGRGMMGRGMGGHWGNGNPTTCPFYEQGGLHNPEQCPFWQQNQAATPEATAEPGQ